MERVALPENFVLKREGNTNMYLNSVNLLLTRGAVLEPRAKLAVDRAGSGGHVHIRSCYNNKYWVRSAEHATEITAKSEKKVEDRSAWNCTLFQVNVKNEVATFTHVNTGFGLVFSGTRLMLSSKLNSHASLNFIPYDLLTILPKQVIFESDRQERYYRMHQQKGYPFISDRSTDLADAANVFETLYNDDGSVRILCKENGRFWRRSPNWIWADTTQNNSRIDDCTFEIVHDRSKGEIALKNRGNGRFISRLTADRKDSCLNAAVTTMTAETRLKVHEPVFRRDIEIIEFHIDRARIYDESLQAMVSNEANNDSPSEANMLVSMTYKDSKTTSWSNSISVSVGLTSKFRAGAPFIAEGGIELSTEVSNTYEWGQTQEISTEVTGSYSITVPPNSRMKVTLMATRGNCDVPFTYLQIDQYLDGRRETFKRDDGLFKGANYYNYFYDSTQI